MKRGQTQGMPFSMIFSIFLIVVFIVVAFIAIRMFLDFGKGASVGLFYKDLQTEIDDVWQSQSSETIFKIDLPEGVTKVCFANLTATINRRGEDYDAIKDFEYTDANVFLIPPSEAEGLEYYELSHIDIAKTTESANPMCVDVSNDLVLKKGFYDKYVVIGV